MRVRNVVNGDPVLWVRQADVEAMMQANQEDTRWLALFVNTGVWRYLFS